MLNTLINYNHTTSLHMKQHKYNEKNMYKTEYDRAFLLFVLSYYYFTIYCPAAIPIIIFVWEFRL